MKTPRTPLVRWLLAVVSFAVVLPSVWLVLLGCGGSGVAHSQRYGGSTALTVFNDMGRTICFVNMGPSSESNWGGDWLGSNEVIVAGAERTFAIAGGQNWDIRLLDCNRAVMSVRMAVFLNGPTRVSAATLAPVSFVVQPVQPVQPVNSGGAASTMGGSLYGN